MIRDKKTLLLGREEIIGAEINVTPLSLSHSFSPLPLSLSFYACI
jgi:hypothetical protein